MVHQNVPRGVLFLVGTVGKKVECQIKQQQNK